MAPIAPPYLDHHKIVKAIERSSLQATFGPEITSTRDLLPQKADVPAEVTVKATQKSIRSPFKKRVRFRIPSIAGKPRYEGLLPTDAATNEDSTPDRTKNNEASTPNRTANNEDSIPDRTTSNGNIPVVSTHRHRSLPSVWSVSGGDVPATSTFENGVTPVVQNNFLGPVPPEMREQKVSYRANGSLSVSFANSLLVLRLKNFVNVRARRDSIAIFKTYLIQIISIQIMTAFGTQRTISASVVLRRP